MVSATLQSLPRLVHVNRRIEESIIAKNLAEFTEKIKLAENNTQCDKVENSAPVPIIDQSIKTSYKKKRGGEISISF